MQFFKDNFLSLDRSSGIFEDLSKELLGKELIDFVKNSSAPDIGSIVNENIEKINKMIPSLNELNPADNIKNIFEQTKDFITNITGPTEQTIAMPTVRNTEKTFQDRIRAITYVV